MGRRFQTAGSIASTFSSHSIPSGTGESERMIVSPPPVSRWYDTLGLAQNAIESRTKVAANAPLKCCYECRHTPA